MFPNIAHNTAQGIKEIEMWEEYEKIGDKV